MSNLSKVSESCPVPNPIERGHQQVSEARNIMTIKLDRLKEMSTYTSEMDLARVAALLPLDHIDAMGEHAFDIRSEKLEAIGRVFTLGQIKYIGPAHFAHDWITQEKLELIGKFTEDQLEALCVGDAKAGEILVQLDIAKIQDLGMLSPETIYILAHGKRKELITSSAGSREWNALMKYNIDYPDMG